MKTIIVLLCSLMLFVSCETLVTDIPESRLPKGTSKLVVHCFISPQNPRIDVVVSESSPIFTAASSKGEILTNAVVRISDGSSEVTIPFDESRQMYSISQDQFPIHPAKTYLLDVSDVARQVSAKCTVPKNTPVIKSYQIDTAVNNTVFHEDTALILKMSWQDIPADTNFYRVKAAAEVEYSVPDAKSMGTRTRNDFYFTWDQMSAWNEWQSDRNLDGSVFWSPTGKANMPSFPQMVSKDGTSSSFLTKCRLISVTMMVYNTDVHYYKYHKSLQQRMDTENPFTEPSLIYGNIEGGLGCFGAYNTGKLIYQPE